MKVLIFIDGLDKGGAARLMSMVANGLCDLGHEVLIAANFHRKVSYDLDNDIKLVDWYPEDYYNHSIPKRIWKVLSIGRKIIKHERPDIIISAVYHIVLLSKICGLGMKIPYIFADQTSFARKDDFFTHFIRWHFYKFGDAVTILTNNDKKILGKHLKRKVVIYNPLTYPIFNGDSERQKIVLAVGHTDRWEIKGFDFLIKSWGIVMSIHPEWSLMIIGGESDKSKEQLVKLAKDNNVLDSIIFGGFRTDTNLLMRTCSVFALSSRIEGFSLSLTEALSQGLPAVSFKIHGVIEDVTDNGHGTILVNDGDYVAFADALDRMMTDEQLRREKSAEGMSFVQKYSPERIIAQWEELIKTVVNKNNS